MALSHWPRINPVELALHLGAERGEPLARLSEALIALCDQVMGPV